MNLKKLVTMGLKTKILELLLFIPTTATAPEINYPTKKLPPIVKNYTPKENNLENSIGYFEAKKDGTRINNNYLEYQKNMSPNYFLK